MRRIEIGRRARQLASILTLLGCLGAWSSPARADSESWDAVFIGGNKIGYMWIRVAPVKDGDRPLVRVRVNYVLSFKRDNDKSTIEVEYGTIETPEGQVLRLDTLTHASEQTIRVHGDVINGKMKMKIENGPQKQEKLIDWTSDTFGPYGAEMSLSRKPIKPGETRKLKTFIPILFKVADATLTARGVEQVALGGGVNRELLRVDQEITLDNGRKAPEMNTTFWIDEGGQILKSFTDSDGGTVSYRTTKEAAVREGPMVDIVASQFVKLDRKINSPEGSRDIVYRVSLLSDEPAEIFPTDRRQTLKTGTEPRTAVLEVKYAGPEEGQPGTEAVDPEYLRSNPMITSDDPRVIALSRRAVGTAVDPWAKAQAITKWVATNLSNKNFETTFAPADEVARTLSGDCTEHGVLTAAMCRAQGIPARVVTGLVYVGNRGGFGFHMWNEVYVNRRWVAVDATFNQTQLDSVHIKLSESSLDGVAPFESFLPVSRVMGKLKLEVIEVR